MSGHSDSESPPRRASVERSSDIPSPLTVQERAEGGSGSAPSLLSRSTRPSLSPNLSPTWSIIDSGRLSGLLNMSADLAALESMNGREHARPTLRFFQWDKKTVSYGYLMDVDRVKTWAHENGTNTVVQRPTGGGVVLHQISDLSLSLLWPRHKNLLSEKPRDAYAAIHAFIKKAIEPILSKSGTSLYTRPTGSCRTETKPERFSLCYLEPVCNDIMIGEKKIIGGALRITRNAILYQGNILLEEQQSVEDVKTAISAVFSAWPGPAL